MFFIFYTSVPVNMNCKKMMDGNLNTQVSDVRNKCSYFSFFFSIRQFHHYTIFYIYICNYLFFWKSVYSWIKINLIYVAKYWMLKKMSSVELMLCSVLWNWTKEPAGIEINMVIDEHSVHNIPFQRNKIDVKWPTVLIKTEPISGWLLYRRHFPLKIKKYHEKGKNKIMNLRWSSNFTWKLQVWSVSGFMFIPANSTSLKGTVQPDFRPPVFFIIRTGLGYWPMG